MPDLQLNNFSLKAPSSLSALFNDSALGNLTVRFIDPDQDMTAFQDMQNRIAVELGTENQLFIVRRTPEMVRRFIDTGKAIIGVFNEGALVAYSSFIPRPDYKEIGVPESHLGKMPPQDHASFLCTTAVEKPFRRPELKLQQKLIYLRAALAKSAGRTHLASEVDIRNASSAVNLLKTGFTIQTLYTNLSDQCRSLLLSAKVDAVLDTLSKPLARLAVPAMAVTAGFSDVAEIERLIGLGYKGVGLAADGPATPKRIVFMPQELAAAA